MIKNWPLTGKVGKVGKVGKGSQNRKRRKRRRRLQIDARNWSKQSSWHWDDRMRGWFSKLKPSITISQPMVCQLQSFTPRPGLTLHYIFGHLLPLPLHLIGGRNKSRNFPISFFVSEPKLSSLKPVFPYKPGREIGWEMGKVHLYYFEGWMSYLLIEIKGIFISTQQSTERPEKGH